MRSILLQATSKIVELARAGRIISARKLFDEMPNKDLIAYNAMLSCYAHLSLNQEALSLFRHMRIADNRPDQYTFTALLSSCSGAGDLRYGLVVHGLVVAFGCHSSLPVSNSLIDMYGKCMSACSAKKVFEDTSTRNEISWCSLLFAYSNSGQLHLASEVFYRMPKRVLISWNTMIVGHARAGDIMMCLSLFRQMREDNYFPDQWTLSALMNVCTKVKESCYGNLVHAFVVKSGWNSCAEVQNSLLSFYTELGNHDDILTTLKTTEALNQVSWNAMIDAYLQMGNTNEAFRLFQEAPQKNVISWTSMIVGCARIGHEKEALNLFVDMIRNCVKPDELSFGSVLLACAELAVLRHGTMVHGFLIHYGFNTHNYVGNGLVNMYAKCGDLAASRKVFNDLIDKDLVSWNTMLFAYGLHGRASEALKLYEDMMAWRITPDEVTFIGLLMTCSHAGLIETGKFLFESMQSVHEVSPKMDHVVCLIDMLGRGGYIVEAASLAEDYKGLFSAKMRSSEALLGACSVRFNVGVGENIGQELIISEPKNEMSYVLLSNLYSSSGNWKEAEMIRKTMADQGIKKAPGCSSIEVKSELVTFVSGDRSHLCMGKILELLHFLQFEMRNNSCLFGLDNG